MTAMLDLVAHPQHLNVRAASSKNIFSVCLISRGIAES
jgi:hypothetical protein